MQFGASKNRTAGDFFKNVAHFISCFLASFILCHPSFSYAQKSTNLSSSLSTEALGAKAFLEDLMTKRLSQELSTKVDKQSFSLGSQLDLIAVRPPIPAPIAQPLSKIPWESEPMSDLMMGALDPEELLKSFAASSSPSDEKSPIRKILEGFKIKSVMVSVGLRDDLAPEVKNEVETWLKTRIAKEFGSAGKGSVSFIKMPTKKKEPVLEKTLWQWLEQFQSLAGQLILGLSIFFGIVAWQLMSRGGGRLRTH